jgi:hypothetical protein
MQLHVTSPTHLLGAGWHIPNWFGCTTRQYWVATMHLTAGSGPHGKVRLLLVEVVVLELAWVGALLVGVALLDVEGVLLAA